MSFKARLQKVAQAVGAGDDEKIADRIRWENLALVFNRNVDDIRLVMAQMPPSPPTCPDDVDVIRHLYRACACCGPYDAWWELYEERVRALPLRREGA